MSIRTQRTRFLPFAQWSGLGAALAGVLFAIWGYVHREGDVYSVYFAAARVLSFVVPLLFLVALAGLYIRCGRRVGWLGESGFVLCFVSSAWGILHPFFIEPSSWYSAWHVYFYQRGWPLASLQWGFWLWVGSTLIGVAAIRMKGLKRWGLLLLAMGLFGWVFWCTDDKVGIVDVRSVHTVFGVLFSLSWVSLGYALWSSKGTVDAVAISNGQKY